MVCQTMFETRLGLLDLDNVHEAGRVEHVGAHLAILGELAGLGWEKSDCIVCVCVLRVITLFGVV